MNSNDDFLQNFAINEKIFTSTSSENDAKTSAWRQQAIILKHITRNSSDSNKLAVLRQHTQKLQYNNHDAFLQQRAHAVDALLKGWHSTNSPDCNDLSDLDPMIESPCRGVFESCRHDEISSSQLEQLYPGGTTPDVSKISTSKFSISSTSQPRTFPVPIAPSSRNTLSSYLQRKPQMETPNIPNLNKEQQQEPAHNAFRTAREELIIQNSKKYGGSQGSATPLFNYGTSKKSLGARRNVRSGFVPPICTDDSTTNVIRLTPPSGSNTPTNTPPDVEPIDERLINIDPKMIELITNEIMHKFKPIDWDDIAGLDYAKSIIKEAVVYPLLRPDIFTGLRRPPRGILLFGPPGTGKTLIGKCIASKSQSTFFSISASSLTSKWIGDGEKMVRALFAVAAVHQPSVVFIDEIDSLLSQRSETEHESSRRLKTEFLVQLDGAATSDDDRILIVGATNRPQELDEAARRRLVRRLYIPLPELEARIQILKNLLQTVRNEINETEIREIGNMTVGYSGADMESLCREASMEPIRTIPADEIPFFNEDKVRPVNFQDFRVALQNVRPSVSQDDLKQYVEWNQIYGAGK